jgi:hypothetical protein
MHPILNVDCAEDFGIKLSSSQSCALPKDASDYIKEVPGICSSNYCPQHYGEVLMQEYLHSDYYAFLGFTSVNNNCNSKGPIVFERIVKHADWMAAIVDDMKQDDDPTI